MEKKLRKATECGLWTSKNCVRSPENEVQSGSSATQSVYQNETKLDSAKRTQCGRCKSCKVRLVKVSARVNTFFYQSVYLDLVCVRVVCFLKMNLFFVQVRINA